MSDYILTKDPSFDLPYLIDKDKVGGVSIKTHFSNDVIWTKALKHTLIDLKWVLGWVAKHEEE